MDIVTVSILFSHFSQVYTLCRKLAQFFKLVAEQNCLDFCKIHWTVIWQLTRTLYSLWEKYQMPGFSKSYVSYYRVNILQNWHSNSIYIQYETMLTIVVSLQWLHKQCDGVSNHQPHDCFFNGLFRRRSKKTSKLRVTGLCEGNSPVTGGLPPQRASIAEMFTFDDVFMISPNNIITAGGVFVTC